ncbi:hypothetical protein [uncultured Litoreibacter sp.]|uniref:hypothetical protein n=1 Tax=uncultured Litoreibacter sp. TaxID=1392394 RepID=UPI0026271FC9|nr:hypothetical protein [uncultured Litoreibacter sp.]
MRMIGIGLMGFLLAGVALLLSTMNILEKGQRYVTELTKGPQLVFEDRRAAPAKDADRAVILRSTPSHPVILSGLPAYQGVAFNMPMDARPTSGYLQIDATLQVLDGVEGVLRISIDNARRGEMLLRPGEVGRSLQIPLSPTDFVRDQLVVSFSLQGEGPKSHCSKDEGFEAVVEIETTSAVYLTLSQPLGAAHDRVIAWGNMARVAWPDWLKADERLRRLVLATQFQQRGIETAMIDDHSADALTTTELRSALPVFTSHGAAPEIAAWPRFIAQNGANAGMRRFHRKTIWRERFALRDASEMRYLKTFELHLALGDAGQRMPWALTVTLNNRLVHQQVTEADQQLLRVEIELPSELQAAVNVIEVTAASTHAGSQPCDDRPELIAEMLPDTKLIAGTTTYSDTMTKLHAALSNIGPLRIGALSSLTAADAQIASTIMARLLPLDATLKPATTTAEVVVFPPQSGAFTLPHADPIWLVSLDTGTEELVVRALEGGSLLPRSSMAVLIIPSAVDIQELAI